MSDDITKNDNLVSNELANHIRWKNRRRMAWISLLYMIVKTTLLLFVVDPERIKVLTEPLTWSYFCAAAIVGSYMGAATFEHIKKG